ncbi:MAG: 50S ribosomal protein L32 [Deferribacterota bacterium]|nr:50S ribosomal protein L32 [Deferribacterota bacterium]
MAVPKKRTTKSRRNNRRSHHRITGATYAKCSNCGELIIPYRICPNCGHYKGREYIEKEEV